MLLFHKKRHGINFYNVWFAEQPLKKAGIISYYEYKGKCPKTDCLEFDTLITDLTEEEDSIKGHFSKNCKYYVNRADKENISFRIMESNDINNNIIIEFCDFFEKFWESKGIHFSDRQKLEEELTTYQKAEALSISYAMVNDETAVYHICIHDGNIARLLHSASLYRLQNDDDGKTRNLIGIANRRLHFEEMKHFKELGLTTYDWGGAGHAEDVIHITEFKESFGGTPVVYYNFEQTIGILAKLFKLLVKILGK